jgi:hypothetical protein
MTNLKPYYDAALKADEEVKRILAEMDTHFNAGTPEGKQKALELRPALEAAQKQAKEANELYASRRDASLVDDRMASLFTLPPDTAQTDQSSEGSKTINRAGFQALDPVARMDFIKAGGRIVDAVA